MPTTLGRVALLTMLLVIGAGAQTPPVTVRVTTSLGDITIEVDSVRAPLTAANFLKYVDGGFYTTGDSIASPARTTTRSRSRIVRSSNRLPRKSSDG